MPSANTNRRLSPPILNQDTDSLNGLNTIHNAVLAMKEVVRGQFGADSNEAQSVGLKKKSDRKRPSRQKLAAAS